MWRLVKYLAAGSGLGVRERLLQADDALFRIPLAAFAKQSNAFEAFEDIALFLGAATAGAETWML